MSLRTCLGLALVLSCFAAAGGGASARSFDVGALRVIHPWTRPTAAGAPTAAGYLSISNRGKTSDTLIAASSPMATKVELHRTSMTDGVMRMRHLNAGLTVAPGETIVLAPGGDHLMLFGPKRAFAKGERVPMILRFRKAGQVKVEMVVDVAAITPDNAMSESRHKH